jgi:hypothetical protein
MFDHAWVASRSRESDRAGAEEETTAAGCGGDLGITVFEFFEAGSSRYTAPTINSVSRLRTASSN